MKKSDHNLNQNQNIFSQEKYAENDISQISVFCSRDQWVNQLEPFGIAC